jgi:hypothetical protein
MTHTNDIGIVATALGAVASAIVTAFIIVPWVIAS